MSFANYLSNIEHDYKQISLLILWNDQSFPYEDEADFPLFSPGGL